ncbi:hypothetical protein AX16_006344 [Volvariella volvacea WC 439]|nr:hypothetical protein AX16_006344 [Volvariella volvacea WC 439]
MLGFNVRVGDGGRPRISPTVRFGNIGFTKQPRPLRHVHRPRTPSPPPPAPPSNHPQENERQLDVEGFTEDDWEALQLSIVMEESRRDAAGRGGDRTGVEAGASSDAGASTGTGASARDPPEQAPPPPYGALDLGGWYDDDDDDAPPRHLGIEAGIEAQRTFGCGICLDRHSSEDVAEVDPCGHEFCRDCLRSYVSTQIGSRRFPIVCPLCSTERDAGQAGEVSELLIEMLGIPEHEFAIYSELQLSQFSVQVHCRG